MSGKSKILRPIMNRNILIRIVEGLERQGGFAYAIGKSALLADPKNLKRLMLAFPEIFQVELRIVKGHHGNDNHLPPRH